VNLPQGRSSRCSSFHFIKVNDSRLKVRARVRVNIARLYRTDGRITRRIVGTGFLVFFLLQIDVKNAVCMCRLIVAQRIRASERR